MTPIMTIGDVWAYATAATTSCTMTDSTSTASLYLVPASGGFADPAPPPRREFNRYVNASDLLEEFISDMARLGMTQAQFLALPINAFITWLVLKAAQADGESPLWRCNACGRFTPPGLVACGAAHAARMLAAPATR